MLPITDALLTSSRNRPALRNKSRYKLPVSNLKGIIAHWTANSMSGADAMANRNYFNTTRRYASAHYVVDDHSIVQCLKDDEVGFHVGALRYLPIGKSIMENSRNPNYFLIGFEMCVNEDGDWDKTYLNSVDLAAHLLNKHNLKIHQLYRHYDITGKDCPKMMIKESVWQKFRQDVNDKLNAPAAELIQTAYVNIDDLNIRKGDGTRYRKVGQLQMGDEIKVYDQLGDWLRIGDEKWVHGDFVVRKFKAKAGTVHVESDTLNVRSGPGTRYEILERMANGAEVVVVDKKGNWLKLEGNRWVYKDYIRFEKVRNGHVRSSFLSVRSGPGTNFPRIKRLTRGDIVQVLDEDGVWFRIKEGEWVHGNYVETVR